MNGELSCYTSNLVAYLARVHGGEPGVALGHAVRLAVRTDLPDGALAFSQHHRIDRVDGWELAYRGTAFWPTAKAELANEIETRGAVLAVANTRYLPWCPQFGKAAVSHWILLCGKDSNCWQVEDHFAALLPDGEQTAYQGELCDSELVSALTPPTDPDHQVVQRDVHALGAAVALPPPGSYRWLGWQRSTSSTVTGTWVEDQDTVLRLLTDRFTEDLQALQRHADDLWAAARHHRHRLQVLAQPDHPAADAWRELPRSLRFAVESAARGRPRPGVVRAAFEAVLKRTAPKTTVPKTTVPKTTVEDR